MELYHIHLLNKYDKQYKEGNEFIVNDNNFNNRLYYKATDLNPCVETKKYQSLVDYLNQCMLNNGFAPFEGLIPLAHIIETLIYLKSDKNINRRFDSKFDENITRELLFDSKKKLSDLELFIRERAMEDYRKDNNLNVPSRLHSLFATHEEGIPFWINNILDGDVDIYKIDVFQEPFVSNERLLPDENLSYNMAYQLSSRYFKPRMKDLDNKTNEYLIQGKVKILEKVAEVKRNK